MQGSLSDIKSYLWESEIALFLVQALYLNYFKQSREKERKEGKEKGREGVRKGKREGGRAGGKDRERKKQLFLSLLGLDCLQLKTVYFDIPCSAPSQGSGKQGGLPGRSWKQKKLSISVSYCCYNK